MNFVGAPALTAADFKNYHQNFILGMSLRVTAPLSQYDGDGPLSSLPASLFTRTTVIFLKARHAKWRHSTRCNQASATLSRVAAWVALNAVILRAGA